MSWMFEWIPGIAKLWLTPTHWSVLTILVCLGFIGGGATFRILNSDGPDPDAPVAAFAVVAITAILSVFWPFLLIALPFAVVAAGLFGSGIYVVRKLENL